MDRGCIDCFKDVRSRRDILIQTQIDAKKRAQEKQKRVAIFQEGQGLTYQCFETTIPPGTIEVIEPSK